MRKIRKPKLGQYVLVTNRLINKKFDYMKHDWYISYVKTLHISKERIDVTIESFPNLTWPYYYALTKHEGKQILSEFKENCKAFADTNV